MTLYPITCKICNRTFNGQLTGNHLKTHGINSIEYQSLHGPTKHPTFLAILTDAGSKGGKSFTKASEWKKLDKLNRIDAYNLNPNKCPICYKPLDYRQFLAKNKFCSSSCGTTHSNRNKKTGTRRSKLEIYLCEQILINFPNASVQPNIKLDGLEFDILVDGKFAIEVNGPVHYIPIWGSEKLESIQAQDLKKIQYCQKVDIKLLVIDSSKQSIFKEHTSQDFVNLLISFLKSG